MRPLSEVPLGLSHVPLNVLSPRTWQVIDQNKQKQGGSPLAEAHSLGAAGTQSPKSHGIYGRPRVPTNRQEPLPSNRAGDIRPLTGTQHMVSAQLKCAVLAVIRLLGR